MSDKKSKIKTMGETSMTEKTAHWESEEEIEEPNTRRRWMVPQQTKRCHSNPSIKALNEGIKAKLIWVGKERKNEMKP